MLGIKSLGLETLELEAELEQSWQLVKKTASDAEREVADKFNVTEENVTAYMSSIEMKVAELLLETGNQMVQEVALSETTPPVNFTKIPHMSEQEFNEGIGGNDGEDNDVMFMSMQDFKKKLDMMS